MEHAGLHGETTALLVLLGVITYALLSRALSRTILTLPILFTGLGLLLSAPLHAAVPADLVHGGKRLLAEITLVLLLFSDASHVRFARLKQDYRLPLRMLSIGMPLSIGLGTAVIFGLAPENGIAMALLTAAVLTPTDAALGQTVVTSPHVPERWKQTINIESGLNDGLALPFVLLGATLASATAAQIDGLASLALLQIVLGPVVGVCVGWGVARALDLARDRDVVDEAAQGVVFVAAAFLTFVSAELVGGNGFIAVFAAGAVFGNVYRHDIHFISEFMEGVGQLLTITAFLIFGAFLLPDGLAHISLMPVLVAVLFLTIVRMGSIWISLYGSDAAPSEKLFLGWFGPRGIASILFTLIIIDEFDIPAEQELLACVSLTVLLSIIAHGVSASPLSNLIGRGSLRSL